MGNIGQIRTNIGLCILNNHSIYFCTYIVMKRFGLGGMIALITSLGCGTIQIPEDAKFSQIIIITYWLWASNELSKTLTTTKNVGNRVIRPALCFSPIEFRRGMFEPLSVRRRATGIRKRKVPICKTNKKKMVNTQIYAQYEYLNVNNLKRYNNRSFCDQIIVWSFKGSSKSILETTI